VRPEQVSTPLCTLDAQLESEGFDTFCSRVVAERSGFRPR